jgi:hypothetical protein
MAAFEMNGNAALGGVCWTTASVVNNWLQGYNLPRVPEMIRLCDQFGITLDWIYRGHVAGIEAKSLVKLQRAIKAKATGRMRHVHGQ